MQAQALPPAYQQSPPPPPGVATYPPEGVTTIIVQQAPPVRDYSHYKGRTAVVLGTIQVVCGVLTIVAIAMVSAFDVQTNTYEHIPFAMIFGLSVGAPSSVFVSSIAV